MALLAMRASMGAWNMGRFDVCLAGEHQCLRDGVLGIAKRMGRHDVFGVLHDGIHHIPADACRWGTASRYRCILGATALSGGMGRWYAGAPGFLPRGFGLLGFLAPVCRGTKKSNSLPL